MSFRLGWWIAKGSGRGSGGPQQSSEKNWFNTRPGPTRACRGSPESTSQRVNIRGLVLRSRPSRFGETRGGASYEYIEGANYLGKREVSLMPRRLLCPNFYGSFEFAVNSNLAVTAPA